MKALNSFRTQEQLGGAQLPKQHRTQKSAACLGCMRGCVSSHLGTASRRPAAPRGSTPPGKLRGIPTRSTAGLSLHPGGLSSQEETTSSPLFHDVDSLAQSTTVIASGRRGHYGALSRLATIPMLFQKAASLKATDGFAQTSNAAHGAPWQATPLHKSFYKVIQSRSVTLCPRNTRRHKTQPFHVNYPVESPPPY